MLTHITLHNFAIVDSLELEFKEGFNALTGETGAGKSIWIDAVQLALGARSDTSFIGDKSDRADITLSFDIEKNTAAQVWLKTNEIDDNECIIRRVIAKDGKSRSTINGTPMPQAAIRQFADHLIQIHGQNQHQALLKKDVQRECLDVFSNGQATAQKVEEIYREWHSLEKQWETLAKKASSRDAELSLLRYQLDELDTLDLQEGEWDALFQENRKLHNANHIMAELNEAAELLVENEQVSAQYLLRQAISRLAAIRDPDEQLQSICELLESAAINLDEAGHALNRRRNILDLSPEHLQEVESRLNKIADLARKHHVAPEILTEVNKSIAQKIHELEKIDEHIASIKQQQMQLVTLYQQNAEKLSEYRLAAAKKLDKAITTQIQSLGINGGSFKIALEKHHEPMNPYGAESVEFLVSTNPGQPYQPMSKIVSGGELSRISLSLSVLTAKKEKTPSLIFDEVDAGIGGATADIVGHLLRTLGEKTQVLCITHLAQVASKAHAHYNVIKNNTKNSTHTSIALLTHDDRIKEIARMLSGKDSKQAYAHAEEMLAI